MNGFEIFHSDEAKIAIGRLVRRYREGTSDAKELAIAAAFSRIERDLHRKIIKAIQLEMEGTTMQSKGFVQNVMIKPVSDACNLACSYCYEGKAEARYGAGFMQIKTLEKIISESLTICGRELTFLWHGGEPTLAGIEFYKSAILFQRQYNKRNIEIRNVIQSNAVNIDETLLEFFISNEFRIGISLDGPASINDRYRYDHAQKGTFHSVLKTIRLLQARNIQFGVITVLNETHKGQAKVYYQFLLDEGIRNIDVHPNFGKTSILPPSEFSDFVIELFDQWSSKEGNLIRVNIFDEIFKVMCNERPTTCYHAGTCSSIFAIEANGNMVPCTRPFDRNIFTFGNVMESSISDIVNAEKYLNFAQFDKIAQNKSKTCPWYTICHNGCPQHRMTDAKQDIRGASVYCQCQSGLKGGNSAIWSHIATWTKDILNLN